MSRDDLKVFAEFVERCGFSFQLIVTLDFESGGGLSENRQRNGLKPFSSMWMLQNTPMNRGVNVRWKRISGWC
ncbi:MAG: hypothetical protein KDD67_05555 [Ignavibacteriae bacterium]|nr:hypothetical protein [Ignavibacteriota bacterium]MCB9214258.1 hypothetical protein [Ignavibacteria bacterium]